MYSRALSLFQVSSIQVSCGDQISSILVKSELVSYDLPIQIKDNQVQPFLFTDRTLQQQHVYNYIMKAYIIAETLCKVTPYTYSQHRFISLMFKICPSQKTFG